MLGGQMSAHPFQIDSYAADADNSKTIVSDQTKATIADIKKTLGKY